ncbi:MAG TPA: acyl-ACP--UDP-N-acetylglucosamine O-acyltransferase [Candidatus Limnocylindria bacterium]|nr:acyl-ACP--UDP-N-acetylglucosamine O-acyltransferase [Candidatus Limnocylindria bacterium]
MPIHPTAIVDRRADIDASAEIGPYVVIDGPVRIGSRTRVLSHVTIAGDTVLGADNVLYPGVHVGHEPQDLSYRGAPTRVRIGDRNVLREGVVVHRATQPDGETTIGSDTFLMSNAHVAHECRVGDHVILASGALLGGHVQVGARAFISGNCVVHQFVRVGRLAIMRGLSRTSRDVPPFALLDHTHEVRGINRVGLRRAGLEPVTIRAIARAFRLLFGARVNLSQAAARVEQELGGVPEVAELLAFIRASKRGVAMGPAAGAARDAADD